MDPLKRLSDNPVDAPRCHSEPFGKPRINSAKNLMDSGSYTLEILRLAVQNDVSGQPLKQDWRFKEVSCLIVLRSQSLVPHSGSGLMLADPFSLHLLADFPPFNQHASKLNLPHVTSKVR